MSNVVPRVSTLYLLMANSNAILNSKRAIASPCLKPLLTLNSADKCSPILTLAYISLFKVLQNLTNFLGNLVYAFHSTFPFSTVSYATWKSINRWGTSTFFFQNFSNISLIVKNLINISSSPSSLLGILLLFPQHKVLILHIKYSPEFCMLYIAMWLLYNDHIPSLMTCHIMPYFHSYGMISSSHIFLIDVHKWPSWTLFLPLYNQFGQYLITSSCFSVFQFTY